MSEWIAAWLAASQEYDTIQRVQWQTRFKRVRVLQKLMIARQERDYARRRLQQLREYWEIDRNQAIALDTHVLDEQQADKRLIDCVYELGRVQRELADARETIATLKAERDKALSRLGAIRLGAMEE